MTQENEHVNKLVAARERMIEDRRALADALATEYKGGTPKECVTASSSPKTPSRPLTALLHTRRSLLGKGRDRRYLRSCLVPPDPSDLKNNWLKVPVNASNELRLDWLFRAPPSPRHHGQEARCATNNNRRRGFNEKARLGGSPYPHTPPCRTPAWRDDGGAT